MVTGYYYPTLSNSLLVHFLFEIISAYILIIYLFEGAKCFLLSTSGEWFLTMLLPMLLFIRFIVSNDVAKSGLLSLHYVSKHKKYFPVKYSTEVECPDCIYKIESPLSRCRIRWTMEVWTQRDVQVTSDMSHCLATDFTRWVTKEKSPLCI